MYHHSLGLLVHALARWDRHLYLNYVLILWEGLLLRWY